MTEHFEIEIPGYAIWVAKNIITGKGVGQVGVNISNGLLDLPQTISTNKNQINDFLNNLCPLGTLLERKIIMRIDRIKSFITKGMRFYLFVFVKSPIELTRMFNNRTSYNWFIHAD